MFSVGFTPENTMHNALLLGSAIVAEVIATSAPKASCGFSKLWPSVLTVLAYGIAFYLLSQTLKRMEIGVVYAIWSGAGTAAMALVGYLAFQRKPGYAQTRLHRPHRRGRGGTERWGPSTPQQEYTVDTVIALEFGIKQATRHAGLQAATVEADRGFGTVPHTVCIGLQHALHDAHQVVIDVVLALLVILFQRTQFAQGHGVGSGAQESKGHW
jgi:small multidrug resistance pump